MSELEQSLAAIQKMSKPTSDAARHSGFCTDFVNKTAHSCHSHPAQRRSAASPTRHWTPPIELVEADLQTSANK